MKGFGFGLADGDFGDDGKFEREKGFEPNEENPILEEITVDLNG